MPWSITPICLDSVVYPDWHPRYGDIGPVYVYVLRGAGVFLVDTGIGPPHPLIDRLYHPTRSDLATAIREATGTSLDEFDGVIMSHLHFDHHGGAGAFRGTPLYAQRAEWEAAQAEKYTIPEFLQIAGANWVLLDGDTELAPGLRLVATAGHTPGHQAVAVDTGVAGPVVLAGQAIETAAELRGMEASGGFTDAARLLLELEPAEIRFSHDHDTWQPAKR
jgi:glyoxylase-like metal-dependent hydrolase (beta-lactamase superfamily II)